MIVAPEGFNYGGGGDQNPNYNMLLLEEGPALDAEGRQWYEKDYDETTTTEDLYGAEGDVFAWEDKTAPFSSDNTYGGLPSCRWVKSDEMGDIYIRRTFSTNLLLSGDVYLACGHDDAPCEYYINGVKVFEKTGFEVDRVDYTYEVIDFDEEGKEIYGDEIIDSVVHYKNGWNNDEFIKLTDEQKDLIRLGGEENLLAVHVHQNWGGAFADCGLYTYVKGGIPMGYVESWDGKVIYNSYGGYNFSGNNNKHALHNWEKLYEAKEGDVYTIHMESSTPDDYEWGSQVHFKTPIKTNDHTTRVKFSLTPSCDYGTVRIKICENDNDAADVTVYDDFISLSEGETYEFEEEFEQALNNMKIVFNFAGGEAGSTIEVADMSVLDVVDDKELFIGSHFFNYFYMKNVTTVYDEENDEEKTTDVEVAWPVVDGRTETLAWTLADFDDEMWDTWAMPVGNAGYMSEVKTVWPGGENTNLWVRRTFELDKINPRLSYALNVCHDDNYETYVNGHLLQKNTGWTDGKHPVQVHIPAKYLNVGKNVIATYIQQNWGGKFYDCGINVEEVNYQECADALKAAIARGEAGFPGITSTMKAELAEVLEAGRNELATNMDAAEVKEYAKNMQAELNRFVEYAKVCNFVHQTASFLKSEDKAGYGDVALANYGANFDTCANNSQCDVFLQQLRYARKKAAAERRTDKFTGVSADEIEDYGMYYILNVKDKRFLGGGENWGAHLATEYVSNAFQLESEKNDEEPLEKGFRINTFRNNGGNLQYMNYGGYADTDTNDAWDFIPVEGKENVFNIVRASVEYEEILTDSEGNDSIVVRHTNTREDGSLFYLGIRDGGENGLGLGFNSWNVVDTDMKDPANEGNQWMLISPEEMDLLMEDATAENPVDASHLIINPGYDQRLTVDYWSGGSVWDRGGNHPDFVYESWNAEYTEIIQTIDYLPEGWYEIDVQGYYRDGHFETHMAKMQLGITPERRAQLVAYTDYFMDDAPTSETSAICSFSDGINKAPGLGRCFDFKVNRADVLGNVLNVTGDGTMYASDACWSAAEEYFQNGLYWNRMAIYVPEGCPLTIGVIKDSKEEGDWIVVDNWRLKYMGNDDIPEDILDGVNDITSSMAAASSSIYNLAGQKLQKVQKGINIVNGKKYIVK